MVDAAVRSESTSFSIFPLSGSGFWWTFIRVFWFNGSLGCKLARQLPEALACAIEIEDPHRAGKMPIGKGRNRLPQMKLHLCDFGHHAGESAAHLLGGGHIVETRIDGL